MSHPIQEEDKIAPVKIVLTGVVALAIFGVGALWSVAIQRDQQNGTLVQETKPSGPAVDHAPEVGIVYQHPFVNTNYANDEEQTKTFANQYHEPAAARLGSYGWVDKSSKVVHIPIDKAIERYVQGGGK